MKFLPLVWYGIWRRPVRTVLIFLQVCVAFALFGVLQGMKTGMDRAIATTPADVLYVGPAVYGEPPLPIADLSRLRSIPGVKAVSFNQGMLTFYQKPTQPVYVLGICATRSAMTRSNPSICPAGTCSAAGTGVAPFVAGSVKFAVRRHRPSSNSFATASNGDPKPSLMAWSAGAP